MTAIQNKTCSKCKVEKSVTLEYFPPNKKSKNGLGSWCRDCCRRYRKTEKMRIYNMLRSRRIYPERKKTIKGFLIGVWNHMTSRCNNPNDISYKNYGGRGIQCLFESCDEFTDYIVNRLQIDPRGLQIDRIDNDGHYEPGNIRFVTHAENQKNKGRK